MSIEIKRSIDIEDVIREILSEYFTVFCPPLPEHFATPSLLVQWVGGDSQGTANGKSKIDTFTVTIDSRAETEAEASENIRNAIGILEAKCRTQSTGISSIEVNSLYSWGEDPVRPDLAMCSTMLLVTAHRETITITN